MWNCEDPDHHMYMKAGKIICQAERVAGKFIGQAEGEAGKIICPVE